MVPRNPNIERRLATLPIAQSERELALKWVNTGNALASMVLALMRHVTPATTHRVTPTRTLKHSH
jgi:hypothetical protein